jgi:hypothetical protein
MKLTLLERIISKQGQKARKLSFPDPDVAIGFVTLLSLRSLFYYIF